MGRLTVHSSPFYEQDLMPILWRMGAVSIRIRLSENAADPIRIYEVEGPLIPNKERPQLIVANVRPVYDYNGSIRKSRIDYEWQDISDGN